MSTRSGLIRQSLIETSPHRTRKGVSPTRSPARNRKSSPILRSSQKSPSRKSPSRKPPSKYPARKSPSRAVKELKEEKTSLSPTKRPTIRQDPEVKLVKISSKIELLRTTRTRHSEYPVKEISSSLSKTEPISSEKLNGLENLPTLTDIYELKHRRVAEDTGLRRSSRLKDGIDNVPDIRRSFNKSLSKSLSKSISKSVDAFSDEDVSDEQLKEKSHSVSRKLSTPLPSSTTLAQINDKFEFQGRIGSCLLYIAIPLTVFYILVSCYNSCTPKTLKDLNSYKSPSLWLGFQASMIVIAQYIIQAVLVCIPIFGTKESDKQGRKYCFNAFFATICTIIALLSLTYYNVININIFLGSYLQMASISYLIGVFLAIALYIKSYYNDDDFNSYGTSGYFIYDFFMGRKIHERFMKVNIKLWLARTTNITTLIFTIFILKNGFYIQEKKIDLKWESLKEIRNKVEIQPTVFAYAMMQMLYVLYFITREKIITSTFYWHSEGLGYLQIVSGALYPYFFTSISKYVVDTGLSMSIYSLTSAVTIYSLGLLLMLISNNIKYEFRKNPLQPKIMYLESMPTFHGKKLLTSHVWGLLRHPNYTGDILIHIALMLPGVLTHQILASAPALIAIVVLLHRSWRDHKRCRRRYGAAWQRYCVKVPSVIIPKIF